MCQKDSFTGLCLYTAHPGYCVPASFSGQMLHGPVWVHTLQTTVFLVLGLWRAHLMLYSAADPHNFGHTTVEYIYLLS